MTRKGTENLRPPFQSPEEARTLGSKGGVRSGEVRREKRTLRQLLEIAMKDLDTETKVDNATAMTLALLSKAKAGDVKAFEVIRDTIGEKPVDKMEMSVHEQAIADMTPEQRREYAREMGKRLGVL